MTNTSVRRPRFRRATAAMPIMQITERDLEILRRIALHRFLRSSQIADLVGGSPRQVRHRLKLLYHHGYVERPMAQIDYYQRGGSKEMVYGLASRGAGRLRRDLNLPFYRMDWNRKNLRAGRLFLEHALMISDVMVAVELGCRKHSGIRFLSRDDIPLPSHAAKTREPFHWHVNVSTRHSVGVIPDAVFGLEDAHLPNGKNRAWFFLEADRGTMPLARPNLNQSSFLRKMLAYEATWTQSIHRTRLGLNRFRVLTITHSAPRAVNLNALLAQLERGQGLFLFSDLQSLLRNGDPIALLR